MYLAVCHLIKLHVQNTCPTPLLSHLSSMEFHHPDKNKNNEETKELQPVAGEIGGGSGGGDVVEDGPIEGTDVKMKKKKGTDEKVAWDPLAVLGPDIMVMVFSRLDACSLARSLPVCRRWHGVASSDRLWSQKCEELWRDKAHIPRSSQAWGLSKLAAYSISIMDGRRTRIMKEDLCDHAWEFHFNDEAPEYWRNLDPYWKGTGPPLRRYFHLDGSLSADPGDDVWGGHESSYSIVTSIEGEGKIRDHYVRINRWPRMAVVRKQDWSWEMSNNLYVYSSIPDAHKKGGTGPEF